MVIVYEVRNLKKKKKKEKKNEINEVDAKGDIYMDDESVYVYLLHLQQNLAISTIVRRKAGNVCHRFTAEVASRFL